MANQKRFAEEYELPYPVLSAPDGSAARKCGVLAQGGRFVCRVTFVVDPDGVVRHIDTKADVVRHGAALTQAVERLRREAAAR